MGTWNVKSLLDTEVSHTQRNKVGDAEDKRVVLLVSELERHQVKITAVQEMKWFGNAVNKIRGSVTWQQADQFLGLSSLGRGERV